MGKYFYNKDKRVKVFQLLTERDSQGYVTTTKKYIHPIDSKICAYFRDLKSSEILANKQAQDESEALFIINRKKVEKDMYIEYKRPYLGLVTYQITGIDGFEDNSNELKLSVKKVNSIPAYDKEEGTEYD